MSAHMGFLWFTNSLSEISVVCYAISTNIGLLWFTNSFLITSVVCNSLSTHKGFFLSTNSLLAISIVYYSLSTQSGFLLITISFMRTLDFPLPNDTSKGKFSCTCTFFHLSEINRKSGLTWDANSLSSLSPTLVKVS